ncbi:hypothetical protein [Paraflavitalea sp. CAU 1676]|uniref:hypothetical protein n=1 Tax=Paraflavitalea sp. CAU 1676 TaxID=3032598 RepID=UPI0023DAF6CC|nr:hypothetical protein [Paraflavitalea sp. CAU 1676]MDF2189847.1 hypothetical protein [Paraflavitalea sp. CAU 1676]
MSPSMAQEIFNALFNAIRENNFDEVGTYLLSDRLNGGFYEDSSTALDQLYRRAQDPDYALTALRQLIDATRNYLRSAADLPAQFEQEVQGFSDRSIGPRPQLNLYTENANLPVNLATVLNNPSLQQLEQLLSMTAEFISTDDQDFFNNLNNNL